MNIKTKNSAKKKFTYLKIPVNMDSRFYLLSVRERKERVRGNMDEGNEGEL